MNCQSYLRKAQNLEQFVDFLEQGSRLNLSLAELAGLLISCSKQKNKDCGVRLYTYLRNAGLETHKSIGNYLVPMLVNVGCIRDARKVFDTLDHKNAWSLASLMSGYITCGKPRQALQLYDEMHSLHLSEHVFVSALKACSKIHDMEKGLAIHLEISRLNILPNVLHVGASLIDMYATCGFLSRAQQIFDQIIFPDIVCWNSLMTGYIEHGLAEEVFECFDLMRAKDIFPDANSLICVLKACRIVGSVHKCEQIHNDIELWGLMERELEVANTLVDTYAKLGLFLEAKQVLSALSSRDVVSWTVLISACVDYEFSDGAFECYEQMQKEHIVPDVVTYVCMLKACNNPDALAKGELLHAEIEKLGMFESNLLVGKTLVDMYVKCHLISRARQVFNRIMVQDVILWTSLIAGYAEHGPSEEALWCFERLQLQGLYPDAVTFVCSLKAAGCIGALDRGQEIHVEAERQGLLECNNVLGNALVDMYAKCGMLSMAQEVFSKLSVQDVVAWNALITGFVEHGPNNIAIMYFDKMQLEGVFPNSATYIWTLKACGDMGNIEKLRGIHAEIDRRGILEADLVVGSTLVDMYGKCGCFSQAVEVFDRLVDKDVLTWNALIAGYVECALYEQAIKCFDQMQDTGISPNAATYVCVLKACGNSGAADKGIELHRQLERHGLVESNLLVGNSLLDMYSKCGSVSQACDVFNKLPVRDVISWTTVMSGYAQIGESKTVFSFFNNMLADGIMPNLITFLVLLSACSRTGLYHASKTFFESMSQEYGIQPTLEHQNSLIDVLNRIGQLDKAISIIREMPFCPNIVVWRSMLGSCQKWGDAAFAKGAFDHAVSLDERNAAVYVLMSHACIAKDIAVTNRSHC